MYKDCLRAGKNSQECMGGYKTCLKGVKEVVATAKPVTSKPVALVTVEDGAKVAKVPADEVLLYLSWDAVAAVCLRNEWP